MPYIVTIYDVFILHYFFKVISILSTELNREAVLGKTPPFLNKAASSFDFNRIQALRPFEVPRNITDLYLHNCPLQSNFILWMDIYEIGTEKPSATILTELQWTLHIPIRTPSSCSTNSWELKQVGFPTEQCQAIAQCQVQCDILWLRVKLSPHPLSINENVIWQII